MSTRSFKFAGIAIAVLMGAAVASAQQGARGGEWTRYGGDAGATKYAPLDQINKDNVSQLRVAWRRPAVDASISCESPRPLLFEQLPRDTADGGRRSLQPERHRAGRGVSSRHGQDALGAGTVSRRARSKGFAATARAAWPTGPTGRTASLRHPRRVPDRARSAHRHAADDVRRERPGQPAAGPRSARDPLCLDRRAQVCRDVVIVGVGIGGSMSDRPMHKEGVPGIVQAFDVRTGKPRWTFNPIPRPGEVGSETWENDSWSYSGDANLWSLISADEELGLAYLPLTAPTSDMYGGHRLGDNVFANTLVCVSCLTGERVWHYQIVHHDLWDYDLPAAPILADITVDGKPIKAVVQLTKQAFAFVFDRADRQTGMADRRAAGSGVRHAGGTHRAHAAVSNQAAAVRSPGRRRSTISSISRRSCALKPSRSRSTTGSVRSSRRPPSEATVRTASGARSSCRARSAAQTGSPAHSIRKQACCTSSRSPARSRLTSSRATRRNPNLNYVSGTRAWTAGPQGLPLFKPPYGRITAIDLNKGDQVWMVPNGEGPRNHPLLKPLNLPWLGNPGRSAPLVTKTLLFLGEGDPVMSSLGSRLRPEMPASSRPAPAARSFAPSTRPPARCYGRPSCPPARPARR